MTPERWRRVQRLFEQALHRPIEVRRAFLTAACGGDAKLEEEVLSLLLVQERSSPTPLLLTKGIAPLARREPPVFAPGDLLAGRYRIERLLGRGGMGEVYEARDEELAIDVAVKALRLDLAADPRAPWRLKRELLLARSVTHPHVCRVYDLGRHGEGAHTIWFLTMELLAGETLQERLRRQGPLPVDEALPYVEQMAAAIGAAHRSGIVHLDFKSANVMIVPEASGERVVVTDFGLSRTAGIKEGDDETRSVLMGTPAYMAPEQILGERAGPAADIYALGVVLYEMVTGTLPFGGAGTKETLLRRLHDDPPSPRSVREELEERWDEAILRCLARDPKLRFARVEDVVVALVDESRIASGASVAASSRPALPAERDTFFGRGADLSDLERRLSSGSRLVTLLGPGGMGKTRLAVRFSWSHRAEWPGGVWFCDLTEARDVHHLAAAVAATIGVVPSRGDPVLQLSHALAARGRCLLILDNLEQLADQAGAPVEQWLERAPDARFLVTSRERLRLREEDVQPVEPLTTEAGVELFVDRARRQRPRFTPSAEEIDSIREIVRLVDGMPLALELAAARMRVMNVVQLVERMRERFRMLSGPTGGRHASLRATIDESWELLQPWEKAGWAQCTVFEGGFTLEAAEAVVDLGAWQDAPWVVDVVQSLVDKSLLRTWEGGGQAVPETRFAMYTSLQEYAREKLHEAGDISGGAGGEEAERAAEERHGRWYAQYGNEDLLRSGAREERQAKRALGSPMPEFENLMVACRRAVARGDGPTAVATYRGAWEVLDLRGPFRSGLELGHRVLACSLDIRDRARALMLVGRAAWSNGGMEEAVAHFEAALAIHRELGDRAAEGIDLSSLAGVHTEQGRMEDGRALYEAALIAHREVGNRRYEGIALGNLGALNLHRGHLDEARSHYEAALAVHREVGNRRSEGIVLGNLGSLCVDRKQIAEGRVYCEAALAIHREQGDRRSEGIVLGYLGILELEEGHLEAASQRCANALAVHREVGNRRYEGIVVGNLGVVSLAQGRLEEARALFEAALGIHREVGNRRSEALVLGELGEVHLEQARPAEARNTFEAGLSILRAVGDQRNTGVLLGKLGRALLGEGRLDEATETLDEAERLLRTIGAHADLGRVLCLQADLEQRRGDMARANAKIEEAERVSSVLPAGPRSELNRSLAKLRVPPPRE